MKARVGIFIKVKALVGAFSEHSVTSRRFVDNSTRRLGPVHGLRGGAGGRGAAAAAARHRADEDAAGVRWRGARLARPRAAGAAGAGRAPLQLPGLVL